MLKEREREGDPTLAFMRKKTELQAERRVIPRKVSTISSSIALIWNLLLTDIY